MINARRLSGISAFNEQGRESTCRFDRLSIILRGADDDAAWMQIVV